MQGEERQGGWVKGKKKIYRARLWINCRFSAKKSGEANLVQAKPEKWS